MIFHEISANTIDKDKRRIPAVMPQAKDARELLAFYLDAGADALIGETPVDRMAEETAPPAARGTVVPANDQMGSREQASAMRADPSPNRLPLPRDGNSRIPLAAPASPEAAVMAAREAARNAQTLDELRALLEAFEGCALRATATQLVFADGNPQSRVMFVGEAPGYDEDIVGRPFVGRSGKLLDLMMVAIGLDRSSAYIANVVPWRPPGNRTPTPQETAICLPFIRRQIELANPDFIVCLGGPAMQTLLAVKDGITRTRGRWFPYDTGTREIRALATFHPAFLLRSPLQKRFAWRDFLALKKALAS
jgi:uracil-DNA glycosylase family 4